MRDIVDGTSNTIMVGERAWELNGTSRKIQCSAASVYGYHGDTGTSVSNIRALFGNGMGGINSKATDYGTSGANGDACRIGFSSMHSGGFQCAMADGAVRFISENISNTMNQIAHPANAPVFMNLLNRQDNQVVGEF